MKFTKIFLLFIFAMTVTVFADDPISVRIEGEPVVFAGQLPAIIDGRTLVPVRGVFEHLGFDVRWDNETRAATLKRTDYEIIITLDTVIFTTNGENHALEVPAQIINGRTMLPIRAVLESAGYSVGWDSATRAVIVSDAPISLPHTIQTKTIRFETIDISVTPPQGWNILHLNRPGTLVPFTSRTYDFEINPPESEKHSIVVTVGRTVDGKPLSDETFFTLYSTRASLFISYAVEDEPDFIDVPIENGTAVYFTLTDAKWVGKTLPPEEYLYWTMFYINFDNGAILYASIFSDEINDEIFTQMLNSLAGIKIN